MSTFRTKIMTPEGPCFDGQVEILVARTLDGEIGILANHERLLSALDPGVVRARQGDRELFFVVGNTIFEVAPECTLLMTDNAIAVKDAAEAAERMKELHAWYAAAETP